MRGSSACISSRRCRSSSANRMRSPWVLVEPDSDPASRFTVAKCGLGSELLIVPSLLVLRAGQRQSHRETATVPRSVAGRLDLTVMITDYPVADGQPQACSLARAATCKKRLKDVTQHLRRHPAPIVGKHKDCVTGLLRHVDLQHAARVHAIE